MFDYPDASLALPFDISHRAAFVPSLLAFIGDCATFIPLANRDGPAGATITRLSGWRGE
jgi:hypothetical protein